ncbi:hypothetical protein G3A39_42340 [Paraburkholderia aspalathi]|nr:hypothetical protein [Paraburkholderia aspalathi]
MVRRRGSHSFRRAVIITLKEIIGVNQMQLVLKSIKYMATLSEETHCYTATLWLDGKRVAAVSNHGHGGPDMQHFTDADAEKRIVAHFAAMPPSDMGLMMHDVPFMSQPDLESWCGERVTDFLILRDVRRVTARKVMGMVGEAELTWANKPADLDKVAADGKTIRGAIVAKYPDIIILNGLDDAAILAAVGRGES